jgi:hypothetical protein
LSGRHGGAKAKPICRFGKNHSPTNGSWCVKAKALGPICFQYLILLGKRKPARPLLEATRAARHCRAQHFTVAVTALMVWITKALQKGL